MFDGLPITYDDILSCVDKTKDLGYSFADRHFFELYKATQIDLQGRSGIALIKKNTNNEIIHCLWGIPYDYSALLNSPSLSHKTSEELALLKNELTHVIEIALCWTHPSYSGKGYFTESLLKVMQFIEKQAYMAFGTTDDLLVAKSFLASGLKKLSKETIASIEKEGATVYYDPNIQKKMPTIARHLSGDPSKPYDVFVNDKLHDFLLLFEST